MGNQVGEKMRNSIIPIRESDYLYTPELDYSDQKLAEYLSKTYKGPGIKGYINSTLNLLHSIEDPIVRKYLVDKFMGEEVIPEMEERSGDYFWDNSFITRAVRPNRSTHELTETLYDNNIDPEKFPLDYHIVKMPSSQATKHRLPAVEEELKRTIKTAVDDKNNGKVKIVNWGSGPGRDTINIAYRLRDTPHGEAMDVTLIDIDPVALEKGEKRAKSMGVLDKFSFQEQDLREVIKNNGNGDYNIGLLIGILCPMDKRLSIGLLRKLRSYLSKDGCLMSSSSAVEMLHDDPFLDFLRVEEGGWPLKYKSEKTMKWIYKLAGFRGDLYFFRDEPWGHHIMCTGYVKK